MSTLFASLQSMQTYLVLTQRSFRHFFSCFETKLEKNLEKYLELYECSFFALQNSIPGQLCSAPYCKVALSKDFSCLDLYRCLGQELCLAFTIHCCEIDLFPGEDDIQMMPRYLPLGN